jgi:hypothetical protein
MGCGEAERPMKGRKGNEDGRGRAAHESGRAKKNKEGRRGRTEEQRGGRAVFMVVEQSGEAVSEAPCPIGGPLNPGGRSSQTQIAHYHYGNDTLLLWERQSYYYKDDRVQLMDPEVRHGQC